MVEDPPVSKGSESTAVKGSQEVAPNNYRGSCIPSRYKRGALVLVSQLLGHCPWYRHSLNYRRGGRKEHWNNK